MPDRLNGTFTAVADPIRNLVLSARADLCESGPVKLQIVRLVEGVAVRILLNVAENVFAIQPTLLRIGRQQRDT